MRTDLRDCNRIGEGGRKSIGAMHLGRSDRMGEIAVPSLDPGPEGVGIHERTCVGDGLEQGLAHSDRDVALFLREILDQARRGCAAANCNCAAPTIAIKPAGASTELVVPCALSRGWATAGTETAALGAACMGMARS